MSNTIDDKLKLAARIVQLRSELAQLEAEFAGEHPQKPRVPVEPAGKGRAPSVSERVMNLITGSGVVGITRRDILAIIPQAEAVASALKVHARAGRIYSDGGFWKLDEAYAAPSPAGSTRPTRELPVVDPGQAYLGQ